MRARGRCGQAKGSIKRYGPKIKDTTKRILPGAVRGPMTFTWQPRPVADPLSHVTLERTA